MMTMGKHRLFVVVDLFAVVDKRWASNNNNNTQLLVRWIVSYFHHVASSGFHSSEKSVLRTISKVSIVN